MNEKTVWKRPEDIATFRTKDPNKILGKFLPHKILKSWTEEFIDEDTGKPVPVVRTQILVDSGEITRGKLQEIEFCLQSGEIEDVEICEENIREMTLPTTPWMKKYNVELYMGIAEKEHYVVYAQTIPQAIIIAAEFGQVYRGLSGNVYPEKVSTVDAEIVPDDHQCIPELERTPAYEPKSYFKVQVRTEWIEEGKQKKADKNYIITAKEVGEAKERISRLIDIKRAQDENDGVHIREGENYIIRKAVPFNVDCVVPLEFSNLYFIEPEKE